MDCAEARKEAQDKNIDCGSITDMIWQRTNAVDVSAGPTGILYSPIYPRNDPFEVSKYILVSNKFGLFLSFCIFWY